LSPSSQPPPVSPSLSSSPSSLTSSSSSSSSLHPDAIAADEGCWREWLALPQRITQERQVSWQVWLVDACLAYLS
jgi:hypothetical protein